MKKEELDSIEEESHAKSLVPSASRILLSKPINSNSRGLSKHEMTRLAYFIFVTLGISALVLATPTLAPSVLISILLFFVFGPLIDSFERKGIPRVTVITALLLIGGLGMALVTNKVTPRISQEIEAFQQGSSKYGVELKQKLADQEMKLLGSSPFFRNLKLVDKGSAWSEKMADKLWTSAPNLASHFAIALFLVPFLTFIFLKDGHKIRRRYLSLVPNRFFETFYSISSRIIEEMGGYVAARIIEAFLVGTIVSVGCMILKVPYAFLLGLMAAITNPIPYIGPIIGAVPALLLSAIEPSIQHHLVWLIVIYLIANLVDMFLIFPMVVAKIVNLHPVVVIISVIFGSQVFGVLGMILAVPIASILKILIQEVYSRIYVTHGPVDV